MDLKVVGCRCDSFGS